MDTLQIQRPFGSLEVVGRRSPQGDAAIGIAIIEDDLALVEDLVDRCQAPGRWCARLSRCRAFAQCGTAGLEIASPDPHPFHITVIDNLASIAAQGVLLAKREAVALAPANIAYGHIQGRRALRAIPIAPGGTLPRLGQLVGSLGRLGWLTRRGHDAGLAGAASSVVVRKNRSPCSTHT